MNLFGRSFEVICEFELKTFYLEKLEERFGSLRTLWSSLRSLKTFECHCVLLCTTLLRRRVTELSNLCGLAQVRAVKKSCHAALSVFTQQRTKKTVVFRSDFFVNFGTSWTRSLRVLNETHSKRFLFLFFPALFRWLRDSSASSLW